MLSASRQALTMAATLAVLSAAAPAADAAPAAATETLSCSVNGDVTFSPALSAQAPPTTVTIGGTAANCLDSQSGTGAVVSGTVTATLKFSALSCDPAKPAVLAPGSTAAFTWTLKDGSQATSTLTGIALTEIDGTGTLTATVTSGSSRLAGEKLTALLNVDSKQPVVDNCIDVLLGTGAPIINSTLTADAAFG
ncbi:hypothetical protein ACFZB9_18160 [Kitasatospora sp. NPDC008050]|uniref:hypothetical protein n=1 Tax=Kitasatospora sp. NPDC008050 TaxID=3364021 RepID=UPI0036E7CE0D